MSSRTMRRTMLVLALAAIAALVPAAGQSKPPPETDGSTYTWPGAVMLTVDVKPWGGGYVRSDPYLIDCPMACIRSFDQNREVKLTAYVTPGHTFKEWEGACAGQGNPCTLKLTGAAVDVAVVFTGQYVPPAPPAPPKPATPPVAVNPSLSVETSGLTANITGSGYNPNSPIDLDFEWSTPPGGWNLQISGATTSDASGAWSYTYVEDCVFGGAYSGPVEFSVTGSDGGGASASGGGTMDCGST